MEFKIDNPNINNKLDGFVDTKNLQGEEKDKFILSNMDRIKTIAYRVLKKQSSNTRATLEDLVQVGVLGLLGSMDNYDPNNSSHASFATFSDYRIKGAMIDSLREEDHFSRDIRTKTRKIWEILDENKKRSAQGLEPLGDEEIAKELGMSLESYRDYLTLATGDSKKHLGISDIEKGNGIIDNETKTAEELVHEKEIKEMLNKAFKKFLSTIKSQAKRERFKDVYKQHFFKEKSPANIAEKHGVTGSRISQQLSEIKEGIKEALKTQGIKKEDISSF